MGPEIILLAQLGAGSPESARISQRQLVDAPKSYVGKPIVVPGIACVDQPRDNFLCLAKVGGQILRIEAGVLGANTSLALSKRLQGDCRGTANLDNPACLVDATITPATAVKDTMTTSAGTTLPTVEIFAPSLDVARPKR